MKRRGFLKLLAGVVAAPAALRVVPSVPPPVEELHLTARGLGLCEFTPAPYGKSFLLSREVPKDSLLDQHLYMLREMGRSARREMETAAWKVLNKSSER